jgi:hypothetical protein
VVISCLNLARNKKLEHFGNGYHLNLLEDCIGTSNKKIRNDSDGHVPWHLALALAGLMPSCFVFLLFMRALPRAHLKVSEHRGGPRCRPKLAAAASQFNIVCLSNLQFK